MLLKGIGRARGARMAAATVLVLTGGQACEIFHDGTCTGLNPPGIRIDVLDAATGRFVPRSANATGVTISGRLRVREPMTSANSDSDHTVLVGAHYRPGVYDVEITAEGYETWRTNDISVEEDNCGHARTVKMTARLKAVDTNGIARAHPATAGSAGVLDGRQYARRRPCPPLLDVTDRSGLSGRYRGWITVGGSAGCVN